MAPRDKKESRVWPPDSTRESSEVLTRKSWDGAKYSDSQHTLSPHAPEEDQAGCINREKLGGRSRSGSTDVPESPSMQGVPCHPSMPIVPQDQGQNNP